MSDYVYPQLQIHHSVAPKLSKLTDGKINLNVGNSTNGVVKVIQSDSWFFEDYGSKEFRIFRLKKNFYLAAIEINESLVTGIFAPRRWQYDKIFQCFESYDHHYTNSKILNRYASWKREYLKNHTPWRQANPTEQGLKEVLVWGHEVIMAYWDDNNWTTEDGSPIEHIWGWMDYE